MKRNKKVIALIETSIFVGVALVLDIIFGAIYQFPFGGTISVSMLPIFLIAARRGTGYGVLGGVAFGLIQSMIYPYVLSVPQYIMDYLVTFGVIGLSGLVKNQLRSVGKFSIAIIIGSLLRLLSASITGILYWKAFIPDELSGIDSFLHTNISGSLSQNMIVIFGSFLYNSMYLVPSAILCILVGIFLVKRGVIQYSLTEKLNK